jgi:YesN/AraC family two-component response regulator
MLLGDFLRIQGWGVRTAENGEEALRALKEKPYDIVISDIYMPVLNGIDLQKSMRRIDGCETIPFIYVSAYADSSTLATLDLSDTVKYLGKSSSPAKLKEWIVYLTSPPEQRGKHPGTETLSRPEARPTGVREQRPPKRR